MAKTAVQLRTNKSSSSKTGKGKSKSTKKSGGSARVSAMRLSKPVLLVFEKDTQGTVRYFQADSNGTKVDRTDPDCVFTALYVQKSAFGKMTDYGRHAAGIVVNMKVFNEEELDAYLAGGDVPASDDNGETADLDENDEGEEE